jgi:phenylacetate-CoA oxygenase PaaI subunit
MYERTDDLPAEIRQDLADWLLTIADSKSLLGLRYAEWATGAPELEADVTISAMAQYEMGHARLLLGVLARMDEDPRTAARSTDMEMWRNIASLDRPAPSWIEVVVLNGLVDALLTVNLQAAMNGNVAQVANRLRKAVSEEEYHTLHAQAWFERMWLAPPEIVERFSDAIRATWADCLTWFGPVGADNSLDRLAAAGFLDGDAATMRQRFVAMTMPLMQGLDLGANAEGDGWVIAGEPDLDGWDPASRRLSPPDFDEGSFAMLTGAHARAMGVED